MHNTSDLIPRVKNALINPKATIGSLNEIKFLVKELCNYTMNITCSDCINEAIMLLSNWTKSNNINDVNHSELFSRAVNGDFSLRKLNLFVQVYKSDNPDRQKELDICLTQNKLSKLFANIIEIEERLTFEQMFDLSKDYPSDINVFANSDIYFDETILFSRFMDPNSCWALSRWDVKKDGMAVLFNRKDSQDVWVFVGKVRQLSNASFCLGVAGCDNRISWELKNAGYHVVNPSKTVHAFHLHNTNYRTYNPKEKVPMPYHFIHPHF